MRNKAVLFFMFIIISQAAFAGLFVSPKLSLHQKVRVKTEWMWESAEITAIKDNLYKVQYIGFSDREEWVDQNKIIPFDWAKNQIVMVSRGNWFSSAEVSDYKLGAFLVHWTEDGSGPDEWVSPNKISKYISPEEKQKIEIEKRMAKFERERDQTKGNLTQKFLGADAEWKMAKVEFFSIMGPGPGKNIHITGSGQVSVEALNYVNKALILQRYAFQLDDKDLTELFDLLIENDFLRIKQEKLEQHLDEVFFTITITNSYGMQYGISESSGDVAIARDRMFYNIYSKLWAIADKTRNLRPIQEK